MALWWCNVHVPGHRFVTTMMTDKYHESSRPLGWGKRRLMKNSSTLYGGNYCDPSGIPIAASPSIPREKRMLRAVAGLIARAKGNGRSKSSSTTATTTTVVPESPAPSPTQLSRANSADTCEETDQGSDEAEENSSSKPRVSFSSEVSVRCYNKLLYTSPFLTIMLPLIVLQPKTLTHPDTCYSHVRL